MTERVAPSAGRPAGRVQEAIAQSVVTVTVPNEQVTGEVRGERDVRIRIDPGHYARVTTARLQGELVTTARLLFAAARRQHVRTFEEATGRTLTRQPAIGRRRTQYAERLGRLAAEGVSDDGEVRVTAVGQQNYAVDIAPGALDRLSCAEFEAACGQAANRLLIDTEQQAARIRWEVFEPLPGVPL